MTSFQRNTAVIVAGVIVIAGVSSALWLFFLSFDEQKGGALLSEPDQTMHVVTLTEMGFTPSEIIIRHGDSVRFVSIAGDPFWPASDLHPTHTIYPAFDPKTPIYPDEGWEFTFNQPGRWRYHNHLDPQQGGVVVVLSATGKLPETSSTCEELEGSLKIQCLDQTLEQYLKDEGIEAAFSYFISIYDANPEIPSVCHGWAHRLGEVAYDMYKEGKEIPLRPEATFCGYGFFHGLIDAMVYDTQSLQSAQLFCEQAVNEKGTELRGMLSSCIHGIGHSILTLMLEDYNNWGNIPQLIDRGGKECEKLYLKSEFLSMCYDGLFHELILSAQDESFGLSGKDYLSHSDLFYYCRDLTGILAESCFYDFVTLWPYFFKEDKNAAMEYVLTALHESDIPQERIIRTFARSFIEFEIAEGTFKDSVDACGLVSDDLFESCMQGLAAGFITHGEPNHMHEKGFAFCRTYYEEEKRSLCFEKMIDELLWNYSVAQMVNACKELTVAERPQQCALY